MGKKRMRYLLSLALILTLLMGTLPSYAATNALEIISVDKVTRAPLQGSMFTIYDNNENVVARVTTGTNGKAIVPTLTAGKYRVVETRVPIGYSFMDRAFDVTYAGPTVTMEIEALKQNGITIRAIDANTNEPISNVRYRLYNLNGNVLATFSTNLNGVYHLPNIGVGTYQVEEVKPANGYLENKGRTTFSVEQNVDKVVTVTNKKASGLVIYKKDSITGEPIQHVKFTIADSNRKPVGEFMTDSNGRILLEGTKIRAGNYYVREVSAPPKYILEPSEKTVTLKEGRLETIIVENTPKTGIIEVHVRSGNANIHDGTPAGEALPNAEYGIFSLASGKLVETIVTKANGWAISNRVPLGEYVLKQTKPPYGYRLNEEETKLVIAHEGEKHTYDMQNYPSNVRISLNTISPGTAKAGTITTYEITDVMNKSTVPVDNFYLRNAIPTDVMKIVDLYTGTYNIRKQYSITVMTNKGREFIAYDGLSTTENNYIDFSASALNLEPKEYITTYQINFGTVPSGFTQLENVRVRYLMEKNLRNGLYFVNKMDAGARYQNEWYVKNSSTLSSNGGTTVIAPLPNTKTRIPNTGY